jgi:hypothetical protein
MKNIWMTIAVVCVVVAVVFAVWRNMEGAFVMAAVGAIAWFLNYRTKVKTALAARETPEEDGEDVNFNEQ